jgi:hypothetical protein
MPPGPTEIQRLIRSRRRTIALIVERDGSLTVRAPNCAPRKEIDAFVREQLGWIERTRERYRSKPQPRKREFVEGERFPFLGREYELRLVRPQRPALKFEDGFTLGASAQPSSEQVFIRWYRDQALRVISKRVKAFAEAHGLSPGKIKITSARTRWGSCSPDGTLNFSWRLVLAPLEVIDYVVVHELAHLRVRSHSRKFWRTVEQILPGYHIQRKWLRENGDTLGL